MREPIDLASDRLRGYVLSCNDESFAGRTALTRQEEPLVLPEKLSSSVVGVDGWETRRRRQQGFDWAIVRLGVPGIIEELVLDTTNFTGNYPPEASVEGLVAPHNAVPHELDGWQEVLSRSALLGNSKNIFRVESLQRFTHLRLNIFPDGGVARLRVMGHPLPNWMAPGRPSVSLMDLAAITNGGSVTDCSDMHYGARQNLIQPGPSQRWDQGWATRRRREPGHDWVVVQLAGPGRIEAVTLDTAHFTGNCPGKAQLEASTAVEPGEADWFELLPAQTMIPHTEHQFVDDIQDNDDVRWVRLNVFPDGGMARLRVWGELSSEGLATCRLGYLNASSEHELRHLFRAVCHSTRWVTELSRSTPFQSLQDLLDKGAQAWLDCGPADHKEALAGHPRIGERASGGDLASKWARGEQSTRAATSNETMLERLRDQQVAYEDRFGFLFLICATGLGTPEILASLDARLENTIDTELPIVAAELAKIIQLRLEKLILL